MKSDFKYSIIGSTIAFIVATSCCWLPALIISLGGASGLLAFSAGLEEYSFVFMMLGSLLFALGVYQYYFKNKSMGKEKEAILNSKITCPECSYEKEETMPTDACQYFYECENCKTILKPLEKDCCVYCSYGTVACPPIQLDNNCC